MEDSTTEATRISINKKIDSFAEGDLEHATDTLSVLWEMATKDGDITAPSSTLPAVSPFRFLHLPGVTRVYLFTQLGHEGHESRPLGLCEDRAHQVDAHRGLFR